MHCLLALCLTSKNSTNACKSSARNNKSHKWLNVMWASQICSFMNKTIEIISLFSNERISLCRARRWIGNNTWITFSTSSFSFYTICSHGTLWVTNLRVHIETFISTHINLFALKGRKSIVVWQVFNATRQKPKNL